MYTYTCTYIYIYIYIYICTILFSLRYQNSHLLISQNYIKTSLNSRAFKNSGPTLWNSILPTML